MSKETLNKYATLAWLPTLMVIWPTLASAQVPVDANGATVAAVEAGAEEIPLLSASDLQVLVGRIALYPDDLLAIVLPASTYPLQLVQAERFLQDLKNDPTLQPNEAWDDSIVALINYPEAVELLTKDLDKTWRLGEAVVAQQADVIAAIESFRDQAYAAGNLQSDTYQTVSQNDGVIEITPVEEDVIYVPYYEPERVVVYQPTPAYYYYPRAYPVYYYPYPYGHAFNRGYFWGVTTAFTVGWFSDSLNVYHHSYHGHPYYGRSYGHNFWYRRPSIHVHNNYYYNRHNNYRSGDRYGHGDYWRPHSGSTVNSHDQRVTRSRHYAGTRAANASNVGRSEVKFRQRTATVSNQSSSIKRTESRAGHSTAPKSVTRSTSTKQAVPRDDVRSRQSIKFRERTTAAPKQLASNQSGQPSRSSEPTRSSQAGRISQPSRSNQSSQSKRSPQVSQPSRASQPSRSSQSPRSGQPSRSSHSNTRQSNQGESRKSQSGESQASGSQPSNPGKSGNSKVRSESGARSERRSGNRR